MYNKNPFQRLLWFLFLLGTCMLVGCNSVPTTTAPAPTKTASNSTSIIDYPITSRGCGQKSNVPAGDSQIQTLLSNSLTRTYLLHIPKGYKDTQLQPLVLNFHGHGSTAQQQSRVSDFSQLADQQDFIVAYPQGLIGPDRRTGWATGPARDPQVNDVLFVSDLLNKLQSTLCVDRLRIYATGFSNGGGMTYVLACKLADRIAAFAPVSGSYPPVPGGCDPVRPISLLEFHGTGDGVVPYNGSIPKNYPPVMVWLQQWVERDSCTSAPTITHPIVNVAEYSWSGCRGGATITHYQIAGWPHAWPYLAGPRPIPYRPSKHGAPTPKSLDATPVIWTFFKLHPLP